MLFLPLLLLLFLLVIVIVIIISNNNNPSINPSSKIIYPVQSDREPWQFRA